MAEALAVYAAEQRGWMIDTGAIFRRNVERLGKASDAADEWLTDPDRPEKYFLGPRANEAEVVYLDFADVTEQGKPTRKRDDLQTLLQRIEAPGTVGAVTIRERYSDPRDYLLKTSEQLRGELVMFMQALALVEARDAKERAEQRAKEQEQENLGVLFNAKLGDGVLEAILTKQFVAARGADEETARGLAREVAAGLLKAIIDAFEETTGG